MQGGSRIFHDIISEILTVKGLDKTKMAAATDQIVAHAQKRKILLLTKYGEYNYGNVLQRYAMTRTLESFGFEVTHLCDVPPFSEKLKTFIKLPVKYILALLGSKKFRRQFQIRRADSLRMERFRKFQDKFTARKIFSSYGGVLRQNKSEWDKYDYAVTGSDQVWHNWTHAREELEYYYLEFIEREKRVCYAPSFGFSKFQEEDIEIHRKGLEGFDRLSCREQEMQGLISGLTGQESELVLDPTLLLAPEQWRKVSSKPEYDVPERYVMCYFLGDITPEYSRAIHDMAGGLPIINVLDINNAEHYSTHPGEFIYLIDHADCVVTDSFHGTAFSVNFSKNFIVFKRHDENDDDFNNMFGRIESILTNTGLMNHVYVPGMTSRLEAVDSVSVNEKLSAMRESSMKYLRECLKVQG